MTVTEERYGYAKFARRTSISRNEPDWTPRETPWVARWHDTNGWHSHCEACGSCRLERKHGLCDVCRQRRARALRRAAAIAICDACRQPFTPARADARYCSPACRQHAYRKRTATKAASR